MRILSDPNYIKHRDPLELFLDDGFSNNETADILRAGGFVVHCFTESFPRGQEIDKREQSIKDSPIIKLCHANRWLLTTFDKNMRKTHVEAIKRYPHVTILAMAHNRGDDPNEWASAVVLAKNHIARKFTRQMRPWYAQLNRQGQLTCCETITENHTTRRFRPRETEESMPGHTLRESRG